MAGLTRSSLSLGRVQAVSGGRVIQLAVQERGQGHDLARTALAAVFAACDDQEQVASLLNELLDRTARPRLVMHPGIPLHLHLDEPGASWGGRLTASGAMALALLIAEHGIEVLGQCAADGCAHVVLRIGPGPRRRYCDTGCASRTRVAAHRASRRASGS